MKFFLIAILTIVVLISGCTQQPSAAPDKSAPAAETLRGISLSPKSFSPQNFTAFFEKAAPVNQVITWAGDWQQLSDEKAAPSVLAQLSSQYGFKPVIITQFFSQGSKSLLRPLTEETKNSYKTGAVDFAQKFKPEYLGLGIEINILAEASPALFDEYASFFSEVYDAIKQVSPGTKIFTVFQLERMKGLQGGLFGGRSDPSLAQWDLLKKFQKADLIAFTTYPGLIHKSPQEIPEDYYDEIAAQTKKPTAFTEIGWFREGPVGWESSAEEQAAFIKKFFQISKNTQPHFIVWSFLYDQKIQEPFSTMGLLKNSEETSPAWEAWKEG